MKMRIRGKIGSCDVIVAVFVWGSQACTEATNIQIESEGAHYWVCSHHIEALKGNDQ